jgi:hypothetical protein
MTDVLDDASEQQLRQLAADMRQAIDRYDAAPGPKCPPGCPCPVSHAINAARVLVIMVEKYDRGELVPGGLPLSGPTRWTLS